MSTSSEIESVAFPTTSTPSLHHDPALDEWRRTEPVKRVHLPFGRWCWMVTRHEDVKLVLTDTTRFSRAAAAADDAPRKTPMVLQRGSLAAMDGPDHLRLRRLVSRALTARRMEELRPRTQDLVDGFLSSMAASGPTAELVEDLALAVPISVICELLGIPFEGRATFRGWADVLLSTGAPDDDPDHNAAIEAVGNLMGYLAQQIACRREHPTDDLLGALVSVRDGTDQLTEEEMAWLAFTMLAGGFETTGHQIAKSAYCLLTHPDLLATLRAKPELWPDAVDELLRFVSLGSGNGLPLVAVEDVELSGTLIRAGDYVITSHSAANMDDAVFDHPKVLDVERTANPHFGLGHGAHYCLGANLAKMEMHVTLQALFERFPDIRLAVPPDEVEWRSGTALVGFAALPVELGAAR